MPDIAAPTANSKVPTSKDAAHPSASEIAPSAPKKKKLVRKQKEASPLKYKLWLGGHAVAIAFGSISFIFQLLWLPNKWYINSIAYRLSLLGSIVALLATLSHKYGLHYLPPSSTLMASQNFQFIVLGLVWLFTFKSVLKILPFFLIAILQLGSHKNISAVTEHSPFVASVIAYNELVLIVYLLLRTLLFRGTSGFQLVLFLLFYWLRILYNPETSNLFKAIIGRADGKISGVKNEKVAHYWEKTKLILEQKTESS
ncbi:hypothetical protein PSN45_005009 [Yamadazyma tenuis]|uniref:Uncharacterized protein n=1 Tax=Candida tenuis (strain ATCC 10573 / BCRC 21748 / CBS 615 / JCM 9827 / NBRC 10315 / NRRL Y-1498 / VKM Y-70) TaxID=590646 RepID=G3B2G6_CANTC|nr:uncharacterized protein CANTEDRAFT_113460 [Yamadazyma tenuis ATCC 10573]EGV64670.1 hypothetical protein CANTEDRAFT_113460 [Yamadazyma tenuis ATCC 10573]WEJ97458.1 hypothetical protein PSN45_005009 [Yamadazyma tenuis]